MEGTLVDGAAEVAVAAFAAGVDALASLDLARVPEGELLPLLIAVEAHVRRAWCESHHVVRWADGGETSVSGSTLLCGWHHRTFEALGWECQILDGVPHWMPPAYLDPERKPRRNLANHPIELPDLTPTTT